MPDEVGGVGSEDLGEMGGKAQNVTAVTFLGHLVLRG
jgi:hypothetical protein